MPIQKTITLYKFEELPTEKARQAAVDWWCETGFPVEDAWDKIKEDASQIGLKLEPGKFGMFEVEFEGSAFECMNAILNDHGPLCETYKIAKRYEEAIDALPDNSGDAEEESRTAQALDALKTDFMEAIGKEYSAMYEREIEWLNSEDAISETLIANEYTFTETGEREDV